MKKQSQEEFTDVKAMLNKFTAKWYYFAISFFILISIALIIIKTSPRVYKVSSILQMKTGTSNAEKILSSVKTADNSVNNLEDEILVIKSTEYIRESLGKLDFAISYYTNDNFSTKEVYKNSFPFVVDIDSSKNQIIGVNFNIKVLSNKEFELEAKGEEVLLYNFDDEIIGGEVSNLDFKKVYNFNQPIKEKFFSFNLSLTGNEEIQKGDKYSFVINSLESLVKKYSKKIDVAVAGRESSILLLSTEGSVIPKEKLFLDTLMYVVKQKNLEKKNIEGIKTIEFIDYQLANVSESLSEVEQDLESFQYTTSNIGESSALYERRDELETELSDLNVKINYLKGILNNLESLESVSKISAPATVGVDDPILSNLLIKLTELNQQRIQVGRTATEANPVVQRLDLEIKTTKEALRDNLSAAISTTNIKIEDVNNRIAQNNQMINRLPSTSIRKLGLQRRFDFSDNTYELFQERKAAAAIDLATNESDWSIVEHAKAEETPVSPNTKFLLLLAIFLAILIPGSLILIKDFFDNTIKSKQDLEKISPIPVLGSVTKGDKHLKLASDYDLRSHLLESLREIRINLQFLFQKKDTKIVGVTSSTSGEGKTFCSINMGIVLAQSGNKVLLLDADLRKSNFGTYFNVDLNKGLSTYLVGNSQLEDLVSSSNIKNLDLIPSGPFPPNPFELLGNEKLDDLISKLKSKYDYIIIDTPPIGLVADYFMFSNYLDASIYIARYKYTKKGFLDKINNHYESGKIKNLSIILNGVKPISLYGDKIYNGSYYKGYFKKELTPKSKKKVQENQLTS